MLLYNSVLRAGVAKTENTAHCLLLDVPKSFSRLSDRSHQKAVSDVTVVAFKHAWR
jgi:hypothetical protein